MSDGPNTVDNAVELGCEEVTTFVLSSYDMTVGATAMPSPEPITMQIACTLEGCEDQTAGIWMTRQQALRIARALTDAAATAPLNITK